MSRRSVTTSPAHSPAAARAAAARTGAGNGEPAPPATDPSTELTATRTRVAQRAERSPVLVRMATATAGGATWLTARSSRTARAIADTVSASGWLLIVLAVGGPVAGLTWGWMEAVVAGIAALLLLLAAVPFLFGARGYVVTVQLAHERVVAGTTVDAEVHVRNTGGRTALPGRLDLPVGAGLVELGVPLLRAGHEVRRHLEIPAARRGVIRIGPPTAVRSDPVGVLRRERRWNTRQDLYVHPQTVAVPAVSGGLIRDLEGSPVQRLVDSDMSFHAIRQYMPGDAQRQIHWKSTAKTGQLMVRQFEQTLRSRLAVVLSIAHHEYASDDEFELGVSAAASLAVQAMRDRREIEVVTGTDIPRMERGRTRAIEVLQAPAPRALLDGFSRIEPASNSLPIEEVCRLMAESADSLALAFIVCGSVPDATRVRRAALAFPPDTSVVAVIVDPTAHPRRQVLAGVTVLTVGVLADLTALMFRAVQS